MAYEDLLHYVYMQEMRVRSVYGHAGEPAPDFLEPPPSTDEQRRLFARVAAHGTPEVHALVRKLDQSIPEFYAEVDRYEDALEQWDDAQKLYAKLDDRRTVIADQVESLETSYELTSMQAESTDQDSMQARPSSAGVVWAAGSKPLKERRR